MTSVCNLVWSIWLGCPQGKCVYVCLYLCVQGVGPTLGLWGHLPRCHGPLIGTHLVPTPPPLHTHRHNISILTVGTVFFNAIYSWNAYSIIHSSQLYASNVIFLGVMQLFMCLIFVSCSSLRRRNPLCQAPHCLQCIVRSALSRNSLSPPALW